MKKTSTTYNAFTIAEMLVVMILSSILVLMVLTILNLTQRHVNGVQTFGYSNDDLITFDRILTNDFNTTDDIFYNKEIDELWSIKPLDTIKYKFEDEYILRNNDTLNIYINNKTCFLAGNIVVSGKIDAVELEITNSKKNFNLFFFNNPDAKSLMEKDTLNY